MSFDETIYVVGSGAVGLPLAVHLTRAGRRAVAVRTSRTGLPRQTVTVTLQDGDEFTSAEVETVSLDRLEQAQGILAVTAKANANEAIARALKKKGARGPLVVMQNGVGVEKPFLEAGFSPLYRCILYLTAEVTDEHIVSFRPVTPMPTGIVEGDETGLEQVVAALNTEGFPFRTEANIQREIWKKAIINAVFNSICPLLDVDNGIFARDGAAEEMAREVVRECVALTDRLELGLSENELMEQLLLISRRSDGQLISTLQDIRAGRPTEIDYLNLEIARVAASLQPPLATPRTALLGKMIRVKAACP